jgi:sugar-specific transcriptional regulator TrmB
MSKSEKSFEFLTKEDFIIYLSIIIEYTNKKFIRYKRYCDEIKLELTNCLNTKRNLKLSSSDVDAFIEDMLKNKEKIIKSIDGLNYSFIKYQELDDKLENAYKELLNLIADPKVNISRTRYR